MRGESGSALNILPMTPSSRLASAFDWALTHCWRALKGRSAYMITHVSSSTYVSSCPCEAKIGMCTEQTKRRRWTYPVHAIGVVAVLGREVLEQGVITAKGPSQPFIRLASCQVVVGVRTRCTGQCERVFVRGRWTAGIVGPDVRRVRRRRDVGQRHGENVGW